MTPTAQKIYNLLLSIRNTDRDDLRRNDLFNNLCEYHEDHLRKEFDEKCISDGKDLSEYHTYEYDFQVYMGEKVSLCYSL